MIGTILESGSGRLGNMLWRAASTIGLARRYGTDPAFESGWAYRAYFSMPGSWFHPRDEVLAMLQAKDLPEVSDLPDGYEQYLQDVSLWWGHRDEVRHVLQPSALAQARVSEAAMIMTDMPRPIMGCHVRRGDNVTNEAGTINCLPASYYVDAVKRVQRHLSPVGKPVKSVLFVTDDPEWCENVLVRDMPNNLEFRVLHGVPRSKEQDPLYGRETPLDWVDLFVLADPRLVGIPMVISNSTFAWMAAFIGGQTNPIRPSYWVGTQLTDQGLDPALLMPRTWTRVIDVADPAPEDRAYRQARLDNIQSTMSTTEQP